jgi:hypothetical protein
MTALSEDVSRGECTTPRQKFFPARAENQAGDPIVFYKGAIVCKRKDSKYVEIPEAANPRTDLIPLGVCECPIDMTGLSDGDRKVTVNPGLLRAFQTGTGDNEITADHVGQTWYMYDDTTAYLTDEGGTLSPGGTIGMIEPDPVDETTALALYFDCENPQVLLALAEQSALIGAGLTASKKTLIADATTITAAASSEALSIGTALPANSRIVGVDIHTLTPFSGGAVADFTVDVGTSGDVDALIDGADLFAAAVDGGPATIPQGIRPNKFFAAGGQLLATFRCGSDDVGDATAGAVTIDVLYITVA